MPFAEETNTDVERGLEEARRLIEEAEAARHDTDGGSGRRTDFGLGPLTVDVLGREAFIKNKRATGRAKDLGDIESLGDA
jgi:hypothetical protein